MIKLNSNQEDFFLLVGSALRYALPRQSYITSAISQIIHSNIDLFSKAELHMFNDDINEAIQTGKTGMDIDVQIWLALQDRIHQEIELR